MTTIELTFKSVATEKVRDDLWCNFVLKVESIITDKTNIQACMYVYRINSDDAFNWLSKVCFIIFEGVVSDKPISIITKWV